MNRHVIKLATIGAAAMLMAGGAFAQNYGDSATSAATPAHQIADTNMFGGPIYNGAPALTVTAALVKAGGGAENFEFSKALVSMLGEKTVNAEVAKLEKQYGKDEVHTFITGMTYAVKDGLKRATEAGVKLPAAPADLHGVALARTLVTAGTTSDGTWWSGYLFDHALSHQLHDQVMADINKNVSTEADMTTHKILNQAMYDVAHALGHTHVKLASLH
ncbi:MAG: hypothetical protein ACRETA_00855 [Gammaproteobacteria bacterium]